MMEARAVLLNEIRYAQRLCERSARLYRRLETFGLWATVVAGSAVVSGASTSIPGWVAHAGLLAFAGLGAALIAVRPAVKAALNENDVRKYAKLTAEAVSMDDQSLRRALSAARETDAPEVEKLRDVAYNDVVKEVGQDAFVVPLSPRQRLLAALA